MDEEDLGATMQPPFPHQGTDQKEATIITPGAAEAQAALSSSAPFPCAYVKGLSPWFPFTI